MAHPKFITCGQSDALSRAVTQLQQLSWQSVQSQADILLLPVPSFNDSGSVKGGGDLPSALNALKEDAWIVGGNLQHPTLAGRKILDFLKDPVYVAKNAQITAHCAIRLAMEKLPCTLSGLPCLVIGWGRIGKCLSALLRQIGAHVTVTARKEADLAMLQALDYDAHLLSGIALDKYRIIFNTVPAPVVSADLCSDNALKIDLASTPGIQGTGVIHARGLPGLMAPESSGALIAQRLCTLLNEQAVLP
jgi:dipicolinate synthase subunit A